MCSANCDKMDQRPLRKIWVCNDVLMDILPFFDLPQLGLKLAILSPRFNALVDTHFAGKSELTIWRHIRIHKELAGPKATLSVRTDGDDVEFPWPDRPLPNKIRIQFIRIEYIDHSVIELLRSNQQIFDKGTNLYLNLCSYKAESNVQPIWDVFVHQIWPIFTTTNVHHLAFSNADHLDALLRLTSPTILSDMNINSIESGRLFPDAIGDDDGPNATSLGQVLSKWLHIPRTDGQPKKLRCASTLLPPPNIEWINSFKETFLHATVSVSYQMNYLLRSSTQIEPFDLVNERTKENLSLIKVPNNTSKWVLKRWPIGETAAIQWENCENFDANFNNVQFLLDIDNKCIGPLSPPSEEEKEGQSNDEMFSTTSGPNDQRNE